MHSGCWPSDVHVSLVILVKWCLDGVIELWVISILFRDLTVVALSVASSIWFISIVVPIVAIVCIYPLVAVRVVLLIGESILVAVLAVHPPLSIVHLSGASLPYHVIGVVLSPQALVSLASVAIPLAGEVLVAVAISLIIIIVASIELFIRVVVPLVQVTSLDAILIIIPLVILDVLLDVFYIFGRYSVVRIWALYLLGIAILKVEDCLPVKVVKPTDFSEDLAQF